MSETALPVDYPRDGPTLFAPSTYWAATPEQRATVCNGCGTAGWKGALVPDTIWGLSVREACDIHDWMYEHGATESDRLDADSAFLNNLIRLINHHGGWLAWARRRRALKCYEAVNCFGGPAYWDPKNAPEDMGCVA